MSQPTFGAKVLQWPEGHIRAGNGDFWVGDPFSACGAEDRHRTVPRWALSVTYQRLTSLSLPVSRSRYIGLKTRVVCRPSFPITAPTYSSLPFISVIVKIHPFLHKIAAFHNISTKAQSLEPILKTPGLPIFQRQRCL